MKIIPRTLAAVLLLTAPLVIPAAAQTAAPAVNMQVGNVPVTVDAASFERLAAAAKALTDNDPEGARVEVDNVLGQPGLPANLEASALLVRAVIYEDVLLDDAAMADLARVLTLRPSDPQALVLRAEIYVRRLRPLLAMGDYDTALASDPDYAFGHFKRANLLLREGRYSDAVGDYTRALSAAEGGLSTIFALRGLAETKLGDKLAARDNFDHVRSDESANNLAVALAGLDAPAAADTIVPDDCRSEPHPVPDVQTAPHFPELSRLMWEQGLVTTCLTVMEDGRVGTVAVTHSSGFADMDQAALVAVKSWHYKPPQGGKPAQVLVRLRFKLGGAD